MFLKNSEIRNNSRLLGEPSRLPGDSSALPRELRVQYFFITINKNILVSGLSPAFRGSSVLMDTEIQNWLVYNYIISNSRCNCYFLLLLLARDWCVVVVELWFLKIKFCLSRTQIKKGRREELQLLLLLSSKTYYSAMECGMVNNPAS